MILIDICFFLLSIGKQMNHFPLVIVTELIQSLNNIGDLFLIV